VTPFLLLFALAFLVSVDLRILAPVLPSISGSLGATPGAVGLAMTGLSAGSAVLGRLVDRGADRAMLALVGVGLAAVGAGTAVVGRRRA
jgi:MFS family permease